MKSELIVDVTAADVTIALLEDGRLVNLQKESRSIEYAVGDIYLAKVKKLMPGLNAAFVLEEIVKAKGLETQQYALDVDQFKLTIK